MHYYRSRMFVRDVTCDVNKHNEVTCPMALQLPSSAPREPGQSCAQTRVPSRAPTSTSLAPAPTSAPPDVCVLPVSSCTAMPAFLLMNARCPDDGPGVDAGDFRFVKMEFLGLQACPSSKFKYNGKSPAQTPVHGGKRNPRFCH